MTQTDLDFLTALNDKLTEKYHYNYRCNMSGTEIPRIGMSFKDYKLTQQELDTIIELAEKEDLFIHPECVDGFQPGFYIQKIEQIAPGLEPEVTTLLSVSERQLPQGHNYNTIEKHILTERNKKHADFLKITIKDGDYYSY